VLNKFGFGCALGVALLLSMLAQAQTTHTDGPFVHAASGMVFPAMVGEFKRFRETLDKGNGASAGYGYASRQGRITATLVVFLPPAEPDFCKEYIDASREGLIRAHPDAQALQPTEAPPVEGYANVASVANRYSYSNTRGGAALRSDHYFYCNVGGKWLVQYDFTYAANLDANSQISSFLHDLRWTIPSVP
jgi:hypothetical protein